MGELDLGLLLAHPMDIQLEQPLLGKQAAHVPRQLAHPPGRSQQTQEAGEGTPRCRLHIRLITDIVAQPGDAVLLIDLAQRPIPPTPVPREHKRRGKVNAVCVQGEHAHNGHGRHVPSQDLVEDLGVLKPLDEIVQAHEHDACHDGEQDGVRQL